VNWGDSSPIEGYSNDVEISHTYITPPPYTISINAQFLGVTTRLDLSSKFISGTLDLKDFDNLYWINLSDNPNITNIFWGSFINKSCRIKLLDYSEFKVKTFLLGLNLNSVTDSDNNFKRYVDLGDIVITNSVLESIIKDLEDKGWEISNPYVKVLSTTPTSTSYVAAITSDSYPVLFRQVLITTSTVDNFISNSATQTLTIDNITDNVDLYVPIKGRENNISSIKLSTISEISSLERFNNLKSLDISDNTGLRLLDTSDLSWVSNDTSTLRCVGTYNGIDVTTLLSTLKNYTGGISRLLDCGFYNVGNDISLYKDSNTLKSDGWVVNVVFGTLLDYTVNKVGNSTININPFTTQTPVYVDTGTSDTNEITDWTLVDSSGNLDITYTGLQRTVIGTVEEDYSSYVLIDVADNGIESLEGVDVFNLFSDVTVDIRNNEAVSDSNIVTLVDFIYNNHSGVKVGHKLITEGLVYNNADKVKVLALDEVVNNDIIYPTVSLTGDPVTSIAFNDDLLKATNITIDSTRIEKDATIVSGSEDIELQSQGNNGVVYNYVTSFTLPIVPYTIFTSVTYDTDVNTGITKDIQITIT
jgi:hypothetical protein